MRFGLWDYLHFVAHFWKNYLHSPLLSAFTIPSMFWFLPHIPLKMLMSAVAFSLNHKPCKGCPAQVFCCGTTPSNLLPANLLFLKSSQPPEQYYQLTTEHSKPEPAEVFGIQMLTITYHILFIYSLIDRRLGCLHLFVLVSMAAMYICVQVFIWIPVSNSCIYT